MNKASNELVAIVLVTVMFLGVLPTIRAQPPDTVPAPCMYLVGPSGTGSETFYTDTVGVGSTFNVTAWVNTTYDEAGWAAALFFNSTQLNVVSVACTANGGHQSAWFYDQGISSNVPPIPYDNSAGTIGEPSGFGEIITQLPGIVAAAVDTLFNITFEVMMVPPAGPGNLTSEVDWEPFTSCIFNTNGVSDPNVSFGSFTYTLTNPPVDVAVTNVVAGKTVVGQGEFQNITVTAANLGDYPETFNVTAFYGNGTSAICTLTPAQWNTFWSMGDVNRDGYINQADMDIIEANYGWTGTPGTNPADINSDGKVDLKDEQICASHQGLNIWTYFLSVYFVGTATVTELPPGKTTSLTITWNATGVAIGNYTISAYAWPLSGETDTSNNNCTGGWVIVSIVGDITGPNGWPDGNVTMRDVAVVARAFGSDGPNYLYPGSPPSSNWNPNADLNNDGTVNMRDVALVARNFGQHSP